jgi:SEC-C motif domain protein
MCYCGKTEEFKDCCELYIKGEAAPSPEALMRSRYSAFTVKDVAYIQATHDPQRRGYYDMEANKTWADSVKFEKLEVLSASENKNKGVVEFKAHYTDLKTGENHIHHEISKFRQQAGIWYYREGRLIEAPPK